MSKFNSKQVAANREMTYEGGLGYVKNPIEEWINFLFCSYAEDRYYESSNTQIERYVELTKQIAEVYGWEFVAKASFFARNYLGMRSISQITAAMLNDVQFEEKRAYFRNFFRRPDDVAEVFSIIENMGSGKRSHALVRGAGDYLSSLGTYSLGKYKMSKKQYNLYDLINITHANSDSINLYKNDNLPVADTWETAISTAAPEDKSNEWKRLVEERKLGYLALLRNLRNILACENIDINWLRLNLCPQIENERAIKGSLVFPYQIYQAYRSIPFTLCVMNSLEIAFCAACKNVPKLPGKTAVLLDVSGSMESPISAKSEVSIKEAGAVFAAMLYLNNSDISFIKFGDRAKVRSFNPGTNNIFTVINQMCYNDNCGYGTNIAPAFEKLNYFVDRIFIISDMQVMNFSWYGSTGIKTFEQYCEVFNPQCKCYSFDLGNYHTQVANPKNKNTYLLTSLSEKIFDFINILESGSDSIVKYIDTNYSYC